MNNARKRLSETQEEPGDSDFEWFHRMVNEDDKNATAVNDMKPPPTPPPPPTPANKKRRPNAPAASATKINVKAKTPKKSPSEKVSRKKRYVALVNEKIKALFCFLKLLYALCCNAVLLFSLVRLVKKENHSKIKLHSWRDCEWH